MFPGSKKGLMAMTGRQILTIVIIVAVLVLLVALSMKVIGKIKP